MSKSFLKKPALKKSSMSRIMLERSISSSSLLKRAAAAVQAEQSEVSRYDSNRSEWKTTSNDVKPLIPWTEMSRNLPTSLLSSMASSGLITPSIREKKHIHFDEQVQQFIALEMNVENDEEHEPHDKYDGDSDDGPIATRKSTVIGESNKITPPTGLSNNGKTIVMLPPTALKYRIDTTEPPNSASPGWLPKLPKLPPADAAAEDSAEPDEEHVFGGEHVVEEDTFVDTFREEIRMEAPARELVMAAIEQLVDPAAKEPAADALVERLGVVEGPALVEPASEEPVPDGPLAEGTGKDDPASQNIEDETLAQEPPAPAKEASEQDAPTIAEAPADDIIESKCSSHDSEASVVDEANSSDSEVTFVYKPNPPEVTEHPRSFHFWMPTAGSMASIVDQSGHSRSKHGVIDRVHGVAMKKSMKFANSYTNSNGPEPGTSEDQGKGSVRSNMGTSRGTIHHHIGRWGRNGGNGHPSLFDNESPFPGTKAPVREQEKYHESGKNSRYISGTKSNSKLSAKSSKSKKDDWSDVVAHDERRLIENRIGMCSKLIFYSSITNNFSLAQRKFRKQLSILLRFSSFSLTFQQARRPGNKKRQLSVRLEIEKALYFPIQHLMPALLTSTTNFPTYRGVVCPLSMLSREAGHERRIKAQNSNLTMVIPQMLTVEETVIHTMGERKWKQEPNSTAYLRKAARSHIHHKIFSLHQESSRNSLL
jgi:hypothetical protein